MSKFRTPRTHLTVAVSFLTATILLLSGCSTANPYGTSSAEATAPLPPLSELTPIEDPTAWQGPSTARVTEPTLPLIAQDPSQDLPATVISHDPVGDTEVVVEDASRVLALSLTGTVAEVVHAYGLADSLVGRDISTELSGYEDLPVVTKQGHSIDAEGVLALNPTLLLTDGSIGPTDVVLQLRDAGVQVVNVTRAKDPESTYEMAREVAEALGVRSCRATRPFGRGSLFSIFAAPQASIICLAKAAASMHSLTRLALSMSLTKLVGRAKSP
jgi:iron complex transport system substrate-binding protein